MFKWLFKKNTKESTEQDPEIIKTILVISGNLQEFQKWCKLNSYDLSQKYCRNIIDDLNIIGLPVEEVQDIVFTGKFWENKMLSSVRFRNFFREWENYIGENQTK